MRSRLTSLKWSTASTSELGRERTVCFRAEQAHFLPFVQLDIDDRIGPIVDSMALRNNRHP